MKKNLLTIIMLALLIVNIVLTGVMMFSVMGTNKKTIELVSNIATVMNLQLTTPGGEEDAVQQVSLSNTEVYKLGSSMTIPLADEEGEEEGSSGNPRYIMFEVALSMDKKNKDFKKYGKEEELLSRESLIQDAITSVVASHTETECRNDFEGLKAEILQSIQNLFDSDFIYNISISQVKYG